MSDFDFDDLLAGAVDDYHAQTAGQIQPAGTQAARATAAHRKRVHTMTMSVLAAVLVVVPISAYAAMDHDHNGPPTVAASHSVAPSTTPSVTASTPPPVVPSSTAPSTPTSTPPSATSTAPITEHQLANATLQIPSWGVFDDVCPHGKVRLSGGQFTSGSINVTSGSGNGLLQVVSADVDHDGNVDAVALIGCHAGDPGDAQVVAFKRTADGSIKTIGQLVRDADVSVTDTVTGIRTITANSNGTIRVQVDNVGGSAGLGVTGQVVQWRTYGWNGSHFAQTAGSRSFTLTTGTLPVQASDIVFQPSIGGSRTGKMTVTIHNTGAHAVSDVSIVFAPDDGEAIELATSSCSAPNDNGASTCAVGAVAAGAARKVTLTVTIKDSDVSTLASEGTLANSGLLVQVRIGDQKVSRQPVLGTVTYQ